MTDKAEPTTFDPRCLHWRKSSFSGLGECVEVADDHHGQVAVRNSNDPDAGIVVFTRNDLGAFIAGIKAGEFDDLT
ncbi:MAG TPA: DUF397 domain-containing protein [Acidimicrobiales bacterium]|jgi:hypothetical protein